tara:strand:- start:2389 stop:2619 length:231 start_codon:yes stop_codon:yes gene_type:complete
VGSSLTQFGIGVGVGSGVGVGVGLGAGVGIGVGSEIGVVVCSLSEAVISDSFSGEQAMTNPDNSNAKKKRRLTAIG